MSTKALGTQPKPLEQRKRTTEYLSNLSTGINITSEKDKLDFGERNVKRACQAKYHSGRGRVNLNQLSQTPPREIKHTTEAELVIWKKLFRVFSNPTAPNPSKWR